VMNSGVRWLVYLSLMTSSFMMVDFQWPGYSDGLSFILVLMTLCVPMSPQARLASVGLCAVNHESLAVALVPIIFFMFPREERYRALMPIAIFYGIMMGGYGFSLTRLLHAQEAVRGESSVWGRIIEEPRLFVGGLFFTYKVFWLLLVLFVCLLWRR